MKLSIIIVNYNVRFYLTQCLLSVGKAIEGIDAEVFVVDNHSRDDSVGYVRKHFPWVKLIAANHNRGFSRANNLAIRHAKGEYILLLNPDTVVAESTLRGCISFLDSHPKAGGAGVEMLTTSGSRAPESRRGIPTVMTSFYKMSGLCSLFPKSRRYGRYYMGYLPWDSAQKIEIISGAFMMLRHKTINEVGLLDEDFFMYGEDIDLSYRIIKAGYDNWYLPYPILHYKGESTKKSSFHYVHVFYNAMLIFFRKHYGHLGMLLSVPIKAAIYVKAIIALGRMVGYNTRRQLGFTKKEEENFDDVIFFGSASSIERSKEVLFDNGVNATFVEASGKSMPRGHLSDGITISKPVVAVYDTSAYSYEQILSIFASKPHKDITMGFYYPMDNIIITPKNIVK